MPGLIKRKTKRLYAIYKQAAGYEADAREFEELEQKGELIPGEIYVVEDISMSSSMTRIDLQGVSEKSLNSVAFKFFRMDDKKLVQHDIYKDPEYNPYI